MTPRAHLGQLRRYNDLGRDSRMRVISVAYLALLPDLPLAVAGTEAEFRPMDDRAAPRSRSTTTASRRRREAGPSQAGVHQASPPS